jgi:uncharacterized protein (TIGR02147 family)
MAISLNIFNYSDYRSFIKDWLEAARKEKSFNLSKLAEVIQVHPTFLSQVLSGSKDLSLEQAAFMGKHLRFTRLEQELFFILVQLERAGTQLLKEYWLERKKEIEAEKNKLSQRFEKHRELTNEQRAVFYSSWIYAAAWSATAIDGGQTAAQISDLFRISLDKAEEILGFLLQCGLCKEHQGAYLPGEMHVHVPNESPFVVRHHSNWRIKSIQKMDNREKSELFFTAPVSIAKKDFDVIREKLNFAIAEIVEVAKDSPAEEVVCLNIDFFHAV